MNGHVRSAIAAPVVASLALAVSSAHAAPKRGARLAWARQPSAATCPTEAELHEEVKKRLEWDPFVIQSSLEMEGVVERTKNGFEAHVMFRDATGKPLGKRDFVSQDADCRTLGETVAIALTVAIDPDAPGTLIAKPAAAAPPTPEPAAEKPTPPPPSRVEASPVHGLRGRVSLLGTASFGVLPKLAPGLSIRGAVTAVRWLDLGAKALVMPEQTTGSLGFALSLAGAFACASPWAESFVAPRWCVEGELGWFQAAVHPNSALGPVDVGSSFWAGAATGPGLLLALSRAVRLEANVFAVVPLTRRQAFVRGSTTPAWEEDLVGARGELGLAAIFE